MRLDKSHGIIGLLLAASLSGFAAGQATSPAPSPGAEPSAQPASPAASERKLPPLPHGTRTVMGGAIRDVDPVRDQFQLKIAGGKTVTIFYDVRTRLFENGARVPVLQLQPREHASVETTLDGTKIFAVSIHTLSHAAEGELQGQVVGYDPNSRKLEVQSALANRTITLEVPKGTPIVAGGQLASSAGHSGGARLSNGSLVDVKFKPGAKGNGVATQVRVLANVGSTFVFSGEVTFVNLHGGRMLIRNSADHQTYQVHFRSALFPASERLRDGVKVRVTARFDGQQYDAIAIHTE